MQVNTTFDQPQKNAIAYLRVSSDRQVENESHDTQEKVIKAYAEQNQLNIIKWYYDEAKSAKNADREELQNLLKYALSYRGKIEHVIVYKMSRASRDAMTYMTKIKAVLASKGITLRSATEPFDETPSGQFLEILHVAMAQFDNNTKREYTLDNMRSLAEQGYYQHPPVVGYEMAKVPNGTGKPRPSLKYSSMFDKVKLVLERYSVGDLSKAELTRYAKENGLRSKTGKVLGEDSINRLLKNPTYAGFICDSFTAFKKVEAVHPSIISVETYERNQLLLNHKSKKGQVHRKFNPIYLLKGTLLCIECKRPFYASAPKTGSGGHSPRYHCGKGCKTRSISAKRVHDEFHEMLIRIKPSDKLLRLYKEILIRELNSRLRHLNKQIRSMNGDLDDVAEKRVQTLEKFTANQISYEEKCELVDVLDQRKLKIELSLNEAKKKQTIKENDIESIVNLMGRVDKQWFIADFEHKQRFQNMIFPDGVVYDDANSTFGTSTISPLYRSVSQKTAPEGAENYHLVAGVGLEPTTSWL